MILFLKVFRRDYDSYSAVGEKNKWLREAERCGMIGGHKKLGELSKWS